MGDRAQMQEVSPGGVSRSAACRDRLADAFGFELLSPEGFEAGGKYLLKRGYR
jgi:hypothetical protein